MLKDTMYNEKAEIAKRKASVCATMNFVAVTTEVLVEVVITKSS